MQKIKYADMHCDTLTECFDRGLSLEDCALQINKQGLKKSGCAVQCFAVFTEGASAAPRFYNYLGYAATALGGMLAVRASDIRRASSRGELSAVLTVENLGFIKCADEVAGLARAGVRMASLVWNYENALAYPNLIFSDEGQPLFSARESRGLKPLGREVLEALDKNKIIADISHLSDGGADEILRGRKIPVVASHSNAAAVCGVSRNLTDFQIKKIADCGGAIGVNYCKDFLGEGDTLRLVAEHIRHIIGVGGEEVVALGSDFDGIPAPPGLEDCSRVPELFDYLEKSGLSPAVLEKLCYKNFMRVFEEVCG